MMTRMLQIKLTVIFILVITAIAPALSLPVKGKVEVKDNASLSSSGSSNFNWHSFRSCRLDISEFDVVGVNLYSSKARRHMTGRLLKEQKN